jgi:hypothetical protein
LPEVSQCLVILQKHLARLIDLLSSQIVGCLDFSSWIAQDLSVAGSIR